MGITEGEKGEIKAGEKGKEGKRRKGEKTKTFLTRSQVGLGNESKKIMTEKPKTKARCGNIMTFYFFYPFRLFTPGFYHA
jgi:hypothetical protein